MKDATKWCFVIAIDAKRDLLYWTQKGPTKGGKGAILRMRLSARPSEVQTLLEGLPESVQLELDQAGETLYWTDHGEPSLGDSLNKIIVKAEFNALAPARTVTDVDIIVKGLHEPIGLVGDWMKSRFYIAKIDGSVWATDLAEGTEPKKTRLTIGGSYCTLVSSESDRRVASAAWPDIRDAVCAGFWRH